MAFRQKISKHGLHPFSQLPSQGAVQYDRIDLVEHVVANPVFTVPRDDQIKDDKRVDLDSEIKNYLPSPTDTGRRDRRQYML